MSNLLDSLEEIITPSMVSIVEKQYNPYLVLWLQEYVTKLGRASDRPQLRWTVSAIPGEAINAFAVVGGNIYFYEGMLSQFPKNIICGVLGHEVAHAARYHCINTLIALYGIDYITGLLALEEQQKIAKIALELMFRGYGRSLELEADRYAVDYNKKAGLYPFGIKHFMEWLVSVEERPTSRLLQLIDTLLSTHPPATERLEKIGEEIKRLGITEKFLTWERIKEALPWLAPIGIGGIIAGWAYARRRK